MLMMLRMTGVAPDILPPESVGVFVIGRIVLVVAHLVANQRATTIALGNCITTCRLAHQLVVVSCLEVANCSPFLTAFTSPQKKFVKLSANAFFRTVMMGGI